MKLAGFNTAQLPAAIAGAIFQPAMRNGKFHGTMPVHTPNGSRRTMLFAGGNGLSPRSMTSGSFSAQPAKNSNVPAPPGTSANIAFLIVPPPSRASISAISAERAVISSATLRSFSARSLPDIFGQGPLSNASRAAWMARCASSRPALATSAIFSPVDGA